MIVNSKMKRSVQFSSAIVLVIALAFSLTACRQYGSTSENDIDTSTYHPQPTPASEYEQKLKFVRDAHFQFVWIFTRKDGKEFDKSDTDILHTNAPKVVDWVKANDGKTFIAGSNFDIDPPQMAVLEKRYKIESDSRK